MCGHRIGDPRLENLCLRQWIVGQVSVRWNEPVVHAFQSSLCVFAAQIDEMRIKILKHEDKQPTAGDPRLENLCLSSLIVGQVSVGWIDPFRKI